MAPNPMRILVLALVLALTYLVPTIARAATATLTYSITTPPAQTIASSSISCGGACSFAVGATQTIGTVSVVMNPASPAFSGSFALVASGGSCSSGNTSAFAITSNTGVLTNTSTSTGAGSYTACVQISESGISNSPQYLTVAITGTTGVVCDYGPPYTGTPPAAAQKAGFTRCAANYDFTVTGSFVDTQGSHQWSNLSSWLACSNSNSTPYLWKFVGSVACGDGVHQVMATTNGLQNLQLLYTVSDGNNGFSNFFQTVGNGNNGNTDGPWRSEYYIEFTIQIDNITPCGSNGCGMFDASTFASQGGSPCFTGSDMEFDANTGGPTGAQTGAGLGPWNCQNGSNGIGPTTGSAPIKQGIMQTWGDLVTGNNLQTNNGTSGFSICAFEQDGNIHGLPASAWISGSGCGVFNITIPPDANIYNPYAALMHTYTFGGDTGGRNVPMVSNAVMHYFRYTLWECQNYDTNGAVACVTNPIITSFP